MLPVPINHLSLPSIPTVPRGVPHTLPEYILYKMRLLEILCFVDVGVSNIVISIRIYATERTTHDDILPKGMVPAG
jgi:hypothetical protein